MKLPHILNVSARTLKDGYERYLAVLNGVLAEEMVKPRSNTRTVEKRVFGVLVGFQNEIVAAANIGFLEVSKHVKSEIGSPIASQVEQERAKFIRKLEMRMEQDARSVVAIMRKFRGDMMNMIRVSEMPEKKARGILRDHYLSTDYKRFTVTDRVGKRWRSDIFVSLNFRKSLLDAYNEVAIYEYRSTPGAFLTVDSLDTSKESFGQRVSVSGSFEDDMSYHKIKDKLFHPNSNSWLKLNRRGT